MPKTFRSNLPGTAVTAMLTVDERLRVDAASSGVFRAHHRVDTRDVLLDVREHRAGAVLVSVRYCEEDDQNSLHRVVREIPRIPTIALLTQVTNKTPQALLQLGHHGVRKVIDVRVPQGWDDLRQFLSEECGDLVEQESLKNLGCLVENMSHECWTFFETLFKASETVTSVCQLAVRFDMLPSTLMSRFFRVGLPAPKRYLAMTRLIRAAYLFENHGFSVANVANHLEYSSPQSFGRHVRAMMGVTAADFRRLYSRTMRAMI